MFVHTVDDIDALNLLSKRPNVRARRDGDARLAHEVDDILSLFTFLDEQKALTDLPIYVCQNPDNMPRPRLFEGDLNVLMALPHGKEGRLCTSSRIMASLSHRSLRYQLTQSFSVYKTYTRRYSLEQLKCRSMPNDGAAYIRQGGHHVGPT